MPYTRLTSRTPPILAWEPVRSLSLNSPGIEPLGGAQVPELQYNQTFKNHHDRRREPPSLCIRVPLCGLHMTEWRLDWIERQ